MFLPAFLAGSSQRSYLKVIMLTDKQWESLKLSLKTKNQRREILKQLEEIYVGKFTWAFEGGNEEQLYWRLLPADPPLKMIKFTYEEFLTDKSVIFQGCLNICEGKQIPKKVK